MSRVLPRWCDAWDVLAKSHLLVSHRSREVVA
jgi:hypothetical protein